MSFATKHTKKSLFIVVGVITTVAIFRRFPPPPPCSQNIHTGNSLNNRITLTHNLHIPQKPPKIPILPML
jgi:hypothetical protein